MIYFIQAEDGPIKIGKAKNPELRLKMLQSANAKKLSIIATGEGGQHEERCLHEKFCAHRITGEWFLPHEDVMRYAELLKTGFNHARELNTVQKSVLALRSQGKSYQEIGKMLGFSKQRAHQILFKARVV